MFALYRLGSVKQTLVGACLRLFFYFHKKKSSGKKLEKESKIYKNSKTRILSTGKKRKRKLSRNLNSKDLGQQTATSVLSRISHPSEILKSEVRNTQKPFQIVSEKTNQGAARFATSLE